MNIQLDTYVFEALGWTLLHSLWIGLLVGLLHFTVMSFTKTTSAHLRYNASCFLLFGFLISTISCFIWYYLSHLPVEETIIPVAISFEAISANITMLDVGSSSSIFAESSSNEMLLILTAIWIAGIFFFILKMGLAFTNVRKLRNSARFTLENKWIKLSHTLTKRLGINKVVELAESSLVKVPCVIGHFKPLILFPIGFVNACTMEEVEAILAHELSHVYRNDFLVNIMQLLTESILYYHPVTWIISNKIREEREHCCDDMAIELSNGTLNYAKALLSSNQFVQTHGGLSMGLYQKQNKLADRIKRILNQTQNNSRIMERLITSTLLLVCVFCISIGASANVTDEPNEPTTEVKESNIYDETTDSKVFIDTISTQGNTSTTLLKEHGTQYEIEEQNGKISNIWADGEKLEHQEIHRLMPLLEKRRMMVPALTHHSTTTANDEKGDTEALTHSTPVQEFSPISKVQEKTVSSLDLDPNKAFLLRYIDHLRDNDSIDVNALMEQLKSMENKIDELNEKIASLEEEDQLKKSWNHIDFMVDPLIAKTHNFDFHDLNMDSILNEARTEFKFFMDESDSNLLIKQREIWKQFDESLEGIDTFFRKGVFPKGTHSFSFDLGDGVIDFNDSVFHSYKFRQNAFPFEKHPFKLHIDDSTEKRFIEELKKDGLINDENNFKLKLTHKYLKIDDQKLDDKWQKKYMDLFEETMDGSLGRRSTFMIHKSDHQPTIHMKKF